MVSVCVSVSQYPLYENASPPYDLLLPPYLQSHPGGGARGLGLPKEFSARATQLHSTRPMGAGVLPRPSPQHPVGRYS